MNVPCECASWVLTAFASLFFLLSSTQAITTNLIPSYSTSKTISDRGTTLKLVLPYLIAYCATEKIVEAIWLGSRYLILHTIGLDTQTHPAENLDSLLSIYTELIFQSVLLVEIAWLVTNAADGRRNFRRTLKRAKWSEMCCEYAALSFTLLAGWCALTVGVVVWDDVAGDGAHGFSDCVAIAARMILEVQMRVYAAAFVSMLDHWVSMLWSPRFHFVGSRVG